MRPALRGARRRGGASPLWEANKPSGLTLYSDISWDSALGGTTLTNGWANAGNNGGFTRVSESSGGFGPWAVQCTSPSNWTGNGDDMGNLYTNSPLNWRRFYICLRHRFSASYQCHTASEKFLYPGFLNNESQGAVLNVSRRADGDGNDMGFLYIPYQNPPGERFGQNIGPRCITRGAWHTIESEWVLNTPNTANGVLRVWVDGTQVINVTDWIANEGAVQTVVDYFRYDTTAGGGVSGIAAPAEGNRRQIDRISLYGATS